VEGHSYEVFESLVKWKGLMHPTTVNSGYASVPLHVAPTIRPPAGLHGSVSGG